MSYVANLVVIMIFLIDQPFDKPDDVDTPKPESQDYSSAYRRGPECQNYG